MHVRGYLRCTQSVAFQAILVSGLILGVAVAALSLVEAQLVKTIGISASVGVVVALLCNLTLVPSLLLIFGECFQHCIRRPVCRCWCRKNPYRVRWALPLLLPCCCDTDDVPVRENRATPVDSLRHLPDFVVFVSFCIDGSHDVNPALMNRRCIRRDAQLLPIAFRASQRGDWCVCTRSY